LFLVVTTIACLLAGLAYELNWIRLRQAVRSQFGFCVEDDNAPVILHLLGENGVTTLRLDVAENQTHAAHTIGGLAIDASYPPLRKAARLFPEALITVGVPERNKNGTTGWRHVDIKYDDGTVESAYWQDRNAAKARQRSMTANSH